MRAMFGDSKEAPAAESSLLLGRGGETLQYSSEGIEVKSWNPKFLYKTFMIPAPGQALP